MQSTRMTLNKHFSSGKDGNLTNRRETSTFIECSICLLDSKLRGKILHVMNSQCGRDGRPPGGVRWSGRGNGHSWRGCRACTRSDVPERRRNDEGDLLAYSMAFHERCEGTMMRVAVKLCSRQFVSARETCSATVES